MAIPFDAMVVKMTATVNSIEPGDVRVEAPRFHVWCEGHVHELVCVDKRDAVERMAFGFVVCDEAQCDWCNDNE